MLFDLGNKDVIHDLFIGNMSFTDGYTDKIKRVIFFLCCTYSVCKSIDDYFTDEITNKIKITEESFSNE